MSDKKYDPTSVLKGVRRGLTNKKEEPKVYDFKPRPQSLCVPLRAFTEGSDALPEDIKALERTGTAIKAHERPDGAVFLGLFELPRQPESAILVFGDPLMELAEAKRTSIEFRRRLQRILDDEMAKTSAELEMHEGMSERTLKLES